MTTTTARPLAVVTGASSGIGLELARQCAKNGYDLILAADRDLQPASEAVQRLGAQVTTVQADLATRAGVETLLSAIGEMIPIVGPILSAIPAIAVASTLGIKKVIAVIIFFLIQQQLENHILVPKIMSRQVGVSPVTVIISLLIGGALLGVVGALLAVPTAAILQVIAAEIVDSEGASDTTKTSKK